MIREFIYKYYIDPIEGGGAYTLVDTLTYALILIVAVFLIYRWMQRTGLAFDRQLLFATLPWVVFGGLALLVLVLDQLTKTWVDASFALASPFAPAGAPDAPTPLLGDLVRIAKSYNDGGIFGVAGDSALVLAAASLGVIAGRRGERSGGCRGGCGLPMGVGGTLEMCVPVWKRSSCRTRVLTRQLR